MNAEQHKSILAIARYATFLADDAKRDREREEIRRIAASFAGEAGADGRTPVPGGSPRGNLMGGKPRCLKSCVN